MARPPVLPRLGLDLRGGLARAVRGSRADGPCANGSPGRSSRRDRSRGSPTVPPWSGRRRADARHRHRVQGVVRTVGRHAGNRTATENEPFRADRAVDAIHRWDGRCAVRVRSHIATLTNCRSVRRSASHAGGGRRRARPLAADEVVAYSRTCTHAAASWVMTARTGSSCVRVMAPSSTRRMAPKPSWPHVDGPAGRRRGRRSEHPRHHPPVMTLPRSHRRSNTSRAGTIPANTSAKHSFTASSSRGSSTTRVRPPAWARRPQPDLLACRRANRSPGSRGAPSRRWAAGTRCPGRPTRTSRPAGRSEASASVSGFGVAAVDTMASAPPASASPPRRPASRR